MIGYEKDYAVDFLRGGNEGRVYHQAVSYIGKFVTIEAGYGVLGQWPEPTKILKEFGTKKEAIDYIIERDKTTRQRAKGA